MEKYFNYFKFLIIINLAIFIFLNPIIRDDSNNMSYVDILLKNNVNLISLNGEEISFIKLLNEKPTLIFIFSRPCSPCERNIVLWKRLYSILNRINCNIRIFGLILNQPGKEKEVEKLNLNFEVYYLSYEAIQLLKNSKYNINASQTILYKQGIKLYFVGNLTLKDVNCILLFCKNLS